MSYRTFSYLEEGAIETKTQEISILLLPNRGVASLNIRKFRETKRVLGNKSANFLF